MGLGPPICTDCRVIQSFDEDTKQWSCSICGKRPKDCDFTALWDLPDDEQKEVELNTQEFKDE